MYVPINKILFEYKGEIIAIKYDNFKSTKTLLDKFASMVKEDSKNLCFINDEEELNDTKKISRRYHYTSSISIRVKKRNNIINKKIMNKNKNNEYITLKYKINDEKRIKIFGVDFVKNNEKNCEILYHNKKYNLKEYFDIENIDKQNIPNNILELKLIINNYITNMSCMFHKSENLISLPDIHKLDTSNVYDMHSAFSLCENLSEIDNGISQWNLENCEDISYLFSTCYSLINMPDISKWNISKVKYMDYLFWGCTKIKSLPDISKWDTSNVENINYLFFNCILVSLLPDISKWNTSNIKYLSHTFGNCSSLIVLPDISIWDMKNAVTIDNLFIGCKNLFFLPDISKWNLTNIKNIFGLFWNCSSLTELPDISKWNISKVYDISFLFSDCCSLVSIPDISKWDINKVEEIGCMFSNCNSLISIPDMKKYINEKFIHISNFSNCINLLNRPYQII